ncbi:MAG: protein-L-isoaspartate(D-aspartate) O-methyltransferase [bacterium]|nr:protein-L-isoaspartate(D-aspartate) O-methyltransferase [bacterium]
MSYHIARKKMVQEQLVARGVKDPRVLEAMESVPRHEFIPHALAPQAYNDHPLNIGHRQTISQPYIVAAMTEALQLQGDEKVLELGTGSGYQAAVLALLCRHLYSIERISTLAMAARQTLFRLGYLNLTLRIGDGSGGWPEEAPFDAIIVTAASPKIPELLPAQLKVGGRMIVPVGDEESQQMTLFIKKEEGIESKNLGDCRFVKLIGEHGFPPTS